MKKKLVLNKMDRVRNIDAYSIRFRCEGYVYDIDDMQYHIVYSNGIKRRYLKTRAHNYLEKIEDKPTMEQILMAYGATFEKVAQIHDEIVLQPKTKAISKVRRNVITGRTQEDAVRDCGAARGVQVFNTRCLGMTTGQAFHKIGEAIMNPNVPIRIVDVDHSISQHGTPRHSANTHFKHTIEEIIAMSNLKGIRFEGGNMIYNPIVTEEIHVPF